MLFVPHFTVLSATAARNSLSIPCRKPASPAYPLFRSNFVWLFHQFPAAAALFSHCRIALSL